MDEEFIQIVLRGGSGTILLDPEQYDYESVRQALLGEPVGVGPHDLHEFQAYHEGGHYLAVFRREEVVAVLSPIF